MQQDGYALRHASPEVRADREVVLAAVQQSGYALRHASLEVRADREVVLAAVQEDGYALEHASPELQQDEELIALSKQAALHDQYGDGKQQVEPSLSAPGPSNGDARLPAHLSRQAEALWRDAMHQGGSRSWMRSKLMLVGAGEVRGVCLLHRPEPCWAASAYM